VDRQPRRRGNATKRAVNRTMVHMKLPKSMQKVRNDASAGLGARPKSARVAKTWKVASHEDRTVQGTDAATLGNGGRRAALLSISSVSAALWKSPWAWAEDSTKFVEPDEKFEIVVPVEWKSGQGKASGSTKAEGSQRNVFVFYPDGRTDTNISVLVTPAAADFTKMGSFGTPYDFGAALVNSLDRGFMKKKNGEEDVQEAKLIDAKEKNGAYIIEYTLKKPDDVPKYFYSSVSMAFDGKYNRLYTATGTCAQSEVDQWRPTLKSSIESFRTTA